MSAHFVPGAEPLALCVEQTEVGQGGSGESPASRGYTAMLPETGQQPAAAAAAAATTATATAAAAGSTRFNLASCCRPEKVADAPNDDNPLPVAEKKPKWVGLGLCYALFSCLFFSALSLLVKKIEGIHSLEISGIRCLFQWLFTFPIIIYKEVDIRGPKGLRVLLFLRGFLGATAMMLLFYAIQQMPLADATVIMFSNTVFVSIFAWIFLKEKCTLLDPIFIVLTLVGVVLIARPRFLFGAHVAGIGGDYKSHIKGTAAAFGSAICAAITLIVIRKMGKSVHYFLSIWYYSLVGTILSVCAVSVVQEWNLPFCGKDRAFLILISLLGVGGQAFLTKALQIEKAAPVALMKTMEVVLAFIFQYFFLNRSPTWWSLGGALCVTCGTSGVAVQKWYTSTRKSKTNQN